MKLRTTILRYTYILSVFIFSILSIPQLPLAQKSLPSKETISQDKALPTIKPALKTVLPPGTMKEAYSYQIKAGGKRPAYCKIFSGTLPKGLSLGKTGRLSGSPSNTGNFLFTIGITDTKKQSVNHAFSITIKKSAALSEFKPGSDVKKNTIRKKDSASTFKILKLSVFFDNYSQKATIDSNAKDHRAYAAITYEGSGWVKGYWQVNGRILSRVKERLDHTKTHKSKIPDSLKLSNGFDRKSSDLQTKPAVSTKAGDQKASRFSLYQPSVKRKDSVQTRKLLESENTYVMTSPELPVRPLPGKRRYDIKFIINDPKYKKFSSKAAYYISAVDPEGQYPAMLIAPKDKSEIDYSPTMFSWEKSQGAKSYHIDFLVINSNKLLFSADTKAVKYEFIPSEHKKEFSTDKKYSWRVTSLDKEGNIIGKSTDYQFTLLSPPTHVKGQILVVLKTSGNASKRIKHLAQKYHLRLLKTDTIRSLRQTMAVFRTEKDIYSIIKAVKKEKDVVMAQPNNIFRTMSEPLNDMQKIHSVCYLKKLHERYTGKNVTVGIVDTGVDTYHKDLKGRIAYHENFIESSHYKGEIHGTAVAGIIGAGINDFGITGVAPGVKILALRACKQVSKAHPEGKCQTYAISRALDTAIEKKADIVNMSFGSLAGDTLLRNLIEEGARRGMVFVAPVGNREDQEVLWFPASHRNVIAVAGTDENDKPFPNAEIASKADVCAPASNLFTTVPGQKHNFLNGTSMSSAVISGLLAITHGKNGRINASQFPIFNGDFCQWEQELLNISLCEE